MPRKQLGPVRKNARQKWCLEDLRLAVGDVKSKKKSLRNAAKCHNVPKTTLERALKNGAMLERKPSLGRKTILPAELEERLVEYCLLMEKKFFGLSRNDVRRMAFQLATQNGIPNPFKDGIAGRAWFDHFLQRHGDKLSIRKPEGTSKARAIGFNKEAVLSFYNILEEEYEKKHYPAHRIYNVDESGLSVVQSKITKVVGMKGKKQISALTAAERGKLVTIIACMSAGGDFVPPMMIFPRKNWTNLLMKGGPPGALGRCHISGWVQSYLFTEWFDHFIQYTRPSEESPVMLILDGHFSHTRNLDVIVKAKENHVTLVCLPPHTTHKLQPLDRTFMGPLKTYYSEEIRQQMRNGGMTMYNIAELFAKAYLRVQTGLIATSGFRCTGIYPLDRNVFSNDEFLEEEANEDQPLVEYDDSLDDMVKPVEDHSNQENQEDEDDLENGIRENQQESVNPSVAHFDPGEGTSSRMITPTKISPIPVIRKKVSNRGRKGLPATILSSSPYKKSLEESIEKKNQQLLKSMSQKRGADAKGKKTAINQKKKKVQKVVISDSEDEENDHLTISSGVSNLEEQIVGEEGPKDVECVFCLEKWSSSKSREKWVKCSMCLGWAHVLCSSDSNKEVYICDFCV